MNIPTTGNTYIDIFIGVGSAILFYGTIYQLWYWMTYRNENSAEFTDFGLVVDMDYVPPKSSTSFNGKTTTTSYTPERHEVNLRTDKIGMLELNHERLYQTVRLDDKVMINYVQVYRVRKDNPQDRKFLRNDIVSVTAPTGRKIAI